MNTLRTTIDLPSPVMRDIKVRAAKAGVSMKTLLTQWVEAALRNTDSSVPTTPKVKPTKHPLPSFVRPHIAGSPVQAALSNAQLHALLADEDVQNIRQVCVSKA